MQTSFRRAIQLVLLFATCSTSSAQNQNDYNWVLGYPPNHPNNYFGGNYIDFNAGTPTVTYFSTPLDLWAPCIMSDEGGSLAFYTNGCRIVNAGHQLIENGDSLNYDADDNGIYLNTCGDGIGYPSSHSILSVPYPGHEGQYFLLHMKRYGDYRTSELLATRIDMNANGGLGKVMDKNQLLLLRDSFSRSSSAVRHGNGRDWWVLVGKNAASTYYLHLLDTAGLRTPALVQQPEAAWIPGQSISYMGIFSPDGSKFARMGGGGGPAAFRIYDFDRCTGTLSNPVTVNLPDADTYAPWICFSPNSRYLYVTNWLERLYQFDTWADDIEASAQLVGVYDGFLSVYDLPTSFFTMTVGPDQRIYMSCANGVNLLHTIHRPDEPGLACDFRQHDFFMPATSLNFLPNNPFYRLYNLPGSPCDTLGVQPPIVAQWRSEPDTSLSPLAIAFTDISYFQPLRWHWDFGDGTSDTLKSPLHVFPAPGKYDVCLTVCNAKGLCDTLCREIEIVTVGTPIPTPTGVLSVSVYPNPATDMIWVAHEAVEEAAFVLLNGVGQVVLRQPLPVESGVEGIRLAGLSPGIYFWQIQAEQKTLAIGKIAIARQ